MERSQETNKPLLTPRMWLPFLLLGFIAWNVIPVATAEITPPSAPRTLVIHETYYRGNTDQDKAPAPHGFVGLDLRIAPNRYPVIQGVFPGSPSDRKGLTPGDRIVQIDGVDTLGKTISEVDAMISDHPGAQVTLTLLRDSQLLRVTITVAAVTTRQTAWSEAAKPDKAPSETAPTSNSR